MFQYMAIVANLILKWHFAAFCEDCDVFIDDMFLEHIAAGYFDNGDRAKVLATIKKPLKTHDLLFVLMPWCKIAPELL